MNLHQKGGCNSFGITFKFCTELDKYEFMCDMGSIFNMKVKMAGLFEPSPMLWRRFLQRVSLWKGHDFCS